MIGAIIILIRPMKASEPLHRLAGGRVVPAEQDAEDDGD